MNQTDHFTFKHDAPDLMGGRNIWKEVQLCMIYFKKSTPTQPFWSDSFHPVSHPVIQAQGGLVISRPIHLSSDLLIWIDILVTIKQTSIEHPIVVELVKNLICYRFSMLLCFSNQGL